MFSFNKENQKEKFKEKLLDSLKDKIDKSRDIQLFPHKMISEKEFIRMSNAKNKALDIVCNQDRK